MRTAPNFNRHWRPIRTDESSAQLTARAEELRVSLRFRDPKLVAARCGGSYLAVGPGRGELHVPFWEKTCVLSWPELMGWDYKDDLLPDLQQALLLYYLITADGSSMTGRWVSFAELPMGRVYSAAFQGYSGDEIVKTFGSNVDEFKRTCSLAGGKEVAIGEASFTFTALPRTPLLVTYWLGDEEFPCSCKILFDESACHYLPLDACAVLGSMLARKLISIPRANS